MSVDFEISTVIVIFTEFIWRTKLAYDKNTIESSYLAFSAWTEISNDVTEKRSHFLGYKFKLLVPVQIN